MFQYFQLNNNNNNNNNRKLRAATQLSSLAFHGSGVLLLPGPPWNAAALPSSSEKRMGLPGLVHQGPGSSKLYSNDETWSPHCTGFSPPGLRASPAVRSLGDSLGLRGDGDSCFSDSRLPASPSRCLTWAKLPVMFWTQRTCHTDSELWLSTRTHQCDMQIRGQCQRASSQCGQALASGGQEG